MKQHFEAKSYPNRKCHLLVLDFLQSLRTATGRPLVCLRGHPRATSIPQGAVSGPFLSIRVVSVRRPTHPPGLEAGDRGWTSSLCAPGRRRPEGGKPTVRSCLCSGETSSLSNRNGKTNKKRGGGASHALHPCSRALLILEETSSSHESCPSCWRGRGSPGSKLSRQAGGKPARSSGTSFSLTRERLSLLSLSEHNSTVWACSGYFGIMRAESRKQRLTQNPDSTEPCS